MYYGKSEEEMTDFEQARKILLESAYAKGMWEAVKECESQTMYLRIQKQEISYYKGLIKACYGIIAELKELDMV